MRHSDNHYAVSKNHTEVCERNEETNRSIPDISSPILILTINTTIRLKNSDKYPYGHIEYIIQDQKDDPACQKYKFARHCYVTCILNVLVAKESKTAIERDEDDHLTNHINNAINNYQNCERNGIRLIYFSEIIHDRHSSIRDN